MLDTLEMVCDAKDFVILNCPTVSAFKLSNVSTLPSEPSSPIPPNSKKPDSGSIVGALTDETLRPELQGNEEARCLMQETLLDEAAFAAADAADKNRSEEVHPTGSSSPSLHISYA